MRTRVDMSLSLLAPEPSPTTTLVERARILLETHPGTLPWAKRLGCDLNDLTRGAATRAKVSEAQSRVHAALAAGLPEEVIKSVSVRVDETLAGTTGGGVVPFAERALASTGARVGLQVRVELETQAGPVSIQARLNP